MTKENIIENATLINEVNDIPIFNVMNVNGYCILYDTQIKCFVFAADIAREGGLVKTEDKVSTTSGRKSYTSLRWERFNDFVNQSIVYFQQINPDVLLWLQLPINEYSYIPLEIALTVLMYCRSDKARQFQVTLASVIAPTITSNAIRVYEAKFEAYERAIEYYKGFIDPENLYSSTEIAKEFYMSAKTLNKLLHYLRIIFPVNGNWEIMQPLVRFGYTKCKILTDGNGGNKPHTYWTEAGRHFVFNVLTQYGLEPHKDNSKIIVQMLTDNED